MKESKAQIEGKLPLDGSEALATITKKSNKLAATATSAISSDLNATQNTTTQKTGGGP